MLMGRNALYYEDYVLAIQRFNMVINAKPWLGEPYFYRGLAKFYLEDYSGSEIDCSSALEKNPYMANYYELRALCCINQNKYQLAEEDYKKAIGITPMDRNCWHNMVLCQLELKEYAQADEASSPDGSFVDSGDDFLVAFNEAFYQLHILFVGAIEEVYHITDVERD